MVGGDSTGGYSGAQVACGSAGLRIVIPAVVEGCSGPEEFGGIDSGLRAYSPMDRITGVVVGATIAALRKN